VRQRRVGGRDEFQLFVVAAAPAFVGLAGQAVQFAAACRVAQGAPGTGWPSALKVTIMLSKRAPRLCF
jgi:hypothetical protein